MYTNLSFTDTRFVSVIFKNKHTHTLKENTTGFRDTTGWLLLKTIIDLSLHLRQDLPSRYPFIAKPISSCRLDGPLSSQLSSLYGLSKCLDVIGPESAQKLQ